MHSHSSGPAAKAQTKPYSPRWVKGFRLLGKSAEKIFKEGRDCRASTDEPQGRRVGRETLKVGGARNLPSEMSSENGRGKKENPATYSRKG